MVQKIFGEDRDVLALVQVGLLDYAVIRGDRIHGMVASLVMMEVANRVCRFGQTAGGTMKDVDGGLVLHRAIQTELYVHDQCNVVGVPLGRVQKHNLDHHAAFIQTQGVKDALQTHTRHRAALQAVNVSVILVGMVATVIRVMHAGRDNINQHTGIQDVLTVLPTPTHRLQVRRLGRVPAMLPTPVLTVVHVTCAMQAHSKHLLDLGLALHAQPLRVWLDNTDRRVHEQQTRGV